MRLRVVCGRGEAIAIFSPRIAFMSVDFPTLGLPTRPMNPARTALPYHMIRAIMAVLSLVIGIVALLAPLAGLVNVRAVAFAIPLGLLAVVLGARARKHRIAASAPTGIATAGVAVGV